MATINLSPGDDWSSDPDLPANGGQPWSDADLPGAYGPGGFRNNPRLTPPPGGPVRGATLNSVPPEVSQARPPVNPNPVEKWTNPFTDAHINPDTGKPEFVGGPDATIGPGSPAASGAYNPFAWLNPAGRAGIAAGAILQPTPTANDSAPTDAWFQKPSGVGGMPGPATPFTQPGHPSSIPQGAMPFPQQSPQPGTQQGMPWAGNNNGVPLNAPGPPPRPGRSPVRTPAAAGPAAVAQQPNMGSYDPNGRFIGIPRVNAPAGQSGGRGGGGGPWQTALNLSSLFGGGQLAVPAPAAARPAARPYQAMPWAGNNNGVPGPQPRPGAGAGPGRTPSGPVAPPPTYADPTIAAGGPGHGARSPTPDLPFRHWGYFGG